MSIKKENLLLIAVGIACIGMVARGAFTGLGTIVEFIKADLGISNSVAGFLTTIPLLVFGFFSPFVSKFGEKIGMGRLMGCGLLIVVFGCLVRSYTGSMGLFLGTAAIAAGIAIMNVLSPAIIKLKFPQKIGLLTGIFTASMSVASSLAVGLGVPLAEGLGWGWKHTLGIWALITFVFFLIWLPQCGNQDEWRSGRKNTVGEGLGKKIFRNPLAWQVTLTMGLQSLLFYAFVAWLPTMVEFKGYTLEQAGFFALLYQLICIVSCFVAPFLCDKYKSQSILLGVFGAIYLIGMIMFLFVDSWFILAIAIAFCGIGSGASGSFALAYMALRASNPTQAAELSGIAQSLGYLLAAPATTIMGFLYDINQTWTIPIIILIVGTALWTYFGILAGRNVTLDDYVK